MRRSRLQVTDLLTILKLEDYEIRRRNGWFNAQYHDYIRMYKQWFPNLTEEQLDEKIIHSAINFWFEDEDVGSGKVWNYFKDI